MGQELPYSHTYMEADPGAVLVTTDAFKEKKVSSEIENILLARGVECEAKIFPQNPGVVLIVSRELSSIDLARTMLSIAHVRRIVRSVVPLLAWGFYDVRSFEDVVVIVIEDFLPRLWSDKYSASRIAVRCRFRGIRGESRAEKIIGYYICERLCRTCKIDLESPNVLVLVEQVCELCGAYVGHPDKSILMYRPYVV